MRKIHNAALALAASAALAPLSAGCGKKPATDEATSSSAAASGAAAGDPLKGKTIAWVPLSMGVPLTETWTAIMKKESEAKGMKLELRDPNWNPTAMSQAVSALINAPDKPAVLVVHNPNVQLLAKQLKQAEDSGVHVVQLNMKSNYESDAYVGGDWLAIGKAMAEDIVKTCGKGSGKSGKVAVIQGELTSAVSIQELEGMTSVWNGRDDITIVSNQAANWDSNKARELTATVLKQNPDLCAVVGFWGIMTLGAGQAVKTAGQSGKVLVYSTGEGSQPVCDGLKDGLFDKYWHVSSVTQGHEIMRIIEGILQSGKKPGASKQTSITPVTLLTTQEPKMDICPDAP